MFVEKGDENVMNEKNETKAAKNFTFIYYN